MNPWRPVLFALLLTLLFGLRAWYACLGADRRNTSVTRGEGASPPMASLPAGVAAFGPGGTAEAAQGRLGSGLGFLVLPGNRVSIRR